jgi:TPR repeat protein
MGGADGRHVGDALPFWQQACADGRRNACERLVQIENSYCTDNSAWACNELGGAYRAGAIVAVDAARARDFFARACELRYKPGCFNLLDPQDFVHAEPRVLDLRLLLRERGRNLMETPEPELYARACEHGFEFACARGRP